MLFFHGYRQQGDTVLTMADLTAATDAAGALLIAPDGLERSWAVNGAPRATRDEIAFVEALLDDVRRRWPIDDRRIWISGFSLGASLAWDVACRLGERFAGYFPVAGAFWRPQPTDCPGGPVNLIHVHGRNDTVVPLEGRTIRERWRQGDVFEGFGLWLHRNGCDAQAARRDTIGGTDCRNWTACASGRRLALCLHDGGHEAPAGWYGKALDWISATSGHETARKTELTPP